MSKHILINLLHRQAGSHWEGLGEV